MAAVTQRVRFGDRELTVSHLDKVVYPGSGFTKADVIDYYARIAPVLLPHLSDRILTRVRHPDGTGEPGFFEKHIPANTPSWLRTATVPSKRHKGPVPYIVVDEAATLVWLANMSTIELHTPQWRLADTRADGIRRPDRLVIDLDPGDGVGIAEAADVAGLVRERLDADGLTAFPKTSGKNGVHLVVPVSGTQTADLVSGYAKALARRLAAEHPALVTAVMGARNRIGKVLIDWSQNSPAKTTVAPYSLRALPEPAVSAPVTWRELDSGGTGPFSPESVLRRLADTGDLLADAAGPGPRLPAPE